MLDALASLEPRRERISRVRNSVLCLVGYGLEVTPDSITFLYERQGPQSLALPGRSGRNCCALPQGVTILQ